jgi:glyoxylase-like metal-dependent hydrolase (beta-lactamase superfamily II)
MAEIEVVKQAHLRTLAPGVHAWIGAGGDSNAGAVETGDGIVVLDAQQNTSLGQAFRQALRAKIGKPVEKLVNTHYHMDHVAGNVVFADEAPILAHEKTPEKLHALLGAPDGRGRWTITETITKIRAFYGPNTSDLIGVGDPAWDWFEKRFAPPEYDELVICPPTETFADRYEVRTDDDVVRFYYRGPAHCDGDLIMFLPKARIAFMGDLLFHGRFPWLGDCDLDGWIETLDHTLTLDLDIVVPGHGVPVTLKEVASFRDLLKDLRRAVAEKISQGASEEAAAAEVALPAYAHMGRYDQWLGFDVRNVYRYLKAA